MAWKAVVATALVLLAGCAQPDAGPDEAGDDGLAASERAAHGLDANATSTTGVIRGVVVDEALRPMADVVVTVEGTALVQTTGSAGAFVFEDLEAGTYFVLATLERYGEVRLGVPVAAGVSDPQLTRIVLSYMPGLQPFIEAFKADLFTSIGLPLLTLGGDELGEGNYLVTFDMQPNATVVQAELVWDATTPLGQNVELFLTAWDNFSPLERGLSYGPSPLASRVNATSPEGAANGFYFGAQAKQRAPTSTDAPDPASTAVVNQAFQGFAHVFHNFVPDEGWTFVANGEHPLPA